ncbi:MAG: glycosyltransferase family 4 protein [bacterium]|nr:glycosyltransferase family 4 protein [bacterium]
MRIVIPTADYPPIEGGISTVTVQLSRGLAELGHDVTVVAPHFPGQESFDQGEPVRVVRYRGYGLGWLRIVPLALKSWSNLRQADLVMAINIAYGGVLGWLRRTPYVVFAYAYEFLKFDSAPVFGGLLRRVYASAKCVIAISAFTRDQLVAFGVPEDRVRVVHPGAEMVSPVPEGALDATRRRFLLEDRRVLLAVGRLIPRKGHETLIRALPRIVERFPDTRLVIVGRGPCLQAIVHEATRLGVRDQLLMPGKVSDETVAALYALCDVFVLPTGSGGGGQVEGFGLVFTEAHAHGKPVVAGRSGGVVDAVLDGETGLLVDPDDPDAVADAVIRLLEDPALAHRLGEQGRARVESELNWREFVRRVMVEVEDSDQVMS